MNYQYSEDCKRKECPGTAVFDTACQDFVCSRCNHHHNGACVKCDYDPDDRVHVLENDERGESIGT